MNLQRLWNTHAPVAVRRHFSLPWVVFVVLLLMVLWYIQRNDHLSSSAICQSEVNLHWKLLNETGVNVIPSVPKKRHNGGGSDIAELRDEEDPEERECVDVYTPGDYGALLICIHDPKKDLMVSAHLKNEGGWESENIDVLYQAHLEYPDLMLVDLGCNIGVFTLPAAQFGMEVIAVDAMMASLKLLQRSLFINALSCHVTLIRNALHRTRTQMRINVDPTNIGGSVVRPILEERRGKVPESLLVDAICLDDLVPLVKGRRIFLKIDLEGSESAVLECAEKFFTEVDVKVLLIEWMYLRHNEEASAHVKDFLTRHNMIPTWKMERDREIDPYASNSWPDNVYWMQK